MLYNSHHMSFLFHHRTKKVIKWTWGIISTFIIIGMLFAYSGGLGM